MRRGGGVSGAVSLVMIFCVLCLAVFAALTCATAERERRLTELTADSAAAYYAADAEAVRIVAALGRGERPDTEAEITETLDVFDDGSSLAEFSLPVSDKLSLFVRARLRPDGTYDVLTWRTVYTGAWESEDSIEIWDGE